MDRRAFVRLVGGGVVVAAAAPLAGCSSAIPPEAVAAWSGAGNETDLRRWIVAHAILAPHSHNLQSWLVDLRTPDEIALRCDRGRLLPVTDPFARQIMMSHGTFLEVNAGRACARVQLAGTALGLAMHPLQQALQEYPEQAAPCAEIHALLGAPRPTHTVQMWSRVGHAEPVGPAPRRGLDAHLV